MTCCHEWLPLGRHGDSYCCLCLEVRHHVHQWQSCPTLPSCIVRCAGCGDFAYFSKAVA